MRRLLALLLLCALPSLLPGCATVRPWQRDLHADLVMQAELIPDTVFFDEHFLTTREASAGANGYAGGGCGCN